ncbi:MAG: SDR family oxidoreductase [Erysipelotrichaceae bacterium]
MIQHNDCILISGATDGLGKALALTLAANYDLRLALCGRNPQKMEDLIQELLELNPRTALFTHCFDFADAQAVDAFCEAVLRQWPHVDFLINNAGQNLGKHPVLFQPLDQWQTMLQVNCTAHVQIIQHMLPAMIREQKGHILNVLSSVCLHPMETVSAYSASKKAMEAFSQILTKEVRKDHIVVTGIYPGGIDTAFRAIERPDYLDPYTVAKAIVAAMEPEPQAMVQELIIRPWVETNY